MQQDPFDPDEFAETLAWRATGNNFDPIVLKDAFTKTIEDLKVRLLTKYVVADVTRACSPCGGLFSGFESSDGEEGGEVGARV